MDVFIPRLHAKYSANIGHNIGADFSADGLLCTVGISTVYIHEVKPRLFSS